MPGRPAPGTADSVLERARRNLKDPRRVRISAALGSIRFRRGAAVDAAFKARRIPPVVGTSGWCAGLLRDRVWDGEESIGYPCCCGIVVAQEPGANDAVWSGPCEGSRRRPTLSPAWRDG